MGVNNSMTATVTQLWSGKLLAWKESFLISDQSIGNGQSSCSSVISQHLWWPQIHRTSGLHILKFSLVQSQKCYL